MNRAEHTRRLFFALWPDDAVREQIESLTREWIDGGGAVPAVNFHVTLAFLGAVPESSLDTLRAIGASLRGAPFAFTLDRIESWQAAKVLCLTETQPEPQLLSLAARLRFSLLEQHVDSAPEEFRAHVTLQRRPSRLINAEIGPFIWPVREVVLVESSRGEDGSEYQIIECWRIHA